MKTLTCKAKNLHHISCPDTTARKEILHAALDTSVSKDSAKGKYSASHIAVFREGLAALTPKEQELFECYVSGMTTSEIMERLNIKENTLKFHNKNLYGKLGIKSRKQLTELSRIK